MDGVWKKTTRLDLKHTTLSPRQNKQPQQYIIFIQCLVSAFQDCIDPKVKTYVVVVVVVVVVAYYSQEDSDSAPPLELAEEY